jgi:hypothetical protein
MNVYPIDQRRLAQISVPNLPVFLGALGILGGLISCLLALPAKLARMGDFSHFVTYRQSALMGVDWRSSAAWVWSLFRRSRKSELPSDTWTAVLIQARSDIQASRGDRTHESQASLFTSIALQHLRKMKGRFRCANYQLDHCCQLDHSFPVLG